MSDPHNVFLISSALVAVIGLVVLITAAKLNPILGLIVVSVALGIAAGMPFVKAMQSFETGVGATLGHIALIVALGTMLGKMMAESGAAERIAHDLVAFFGEKRVPWAMALIGIIVGLPAFFEVGFVLLVPVAFTVARRTGKSILLVGLPMLAGLSVAHGLVPPHPAATMAVTIFRADMGRTIFLGLAIGMVAAALAGPLFAQFAARRIQVSGEGGMAEQISEHHLPRALPGFWLSLFTILLPVLLMILGSCADALVAAGSGPNAMLHFIGNDDIALLIGVLVSFLTLGRAQGIARSTILRFTNECLAPTATITLLVGCGGGFGRILQDSGVSQAIVGAVTQSHFSLLLLAWLMAAALRLATGSATVATTTAAAIVAPIAAHAGAVRPELLVLATGAGSLIFSHVNDGGFWLVKEYFNLTVVQTLKTWSVCETIISVTGLVLTLAAARFI